MNVFSILGFGIAIVVVFLGLRLASEDLLMFLNYPSMFIVLGGTLAATAICFQLDRIFFLMKIFVVRMFKGKKYDYTAVIKEIMTIGEAYRKGEPIEQQINKTTDPFLQEALTMLNDGVLEEDHILNLLQKRTDKMLYGQMEEAKKIKTIGKFPPAFGMMGTTIGMIVLLGNLGGEDAIKMVGPAMAVCLITTLYGLIVANIIFIPASENLIDGSKEVYLKNIIIIEGIKLFLKKTNPIIVAEELNSYLPPGKRLNWKDVLGA